MGTLEGYSCARIIFKPHANPQQPRIYSDRSLVELRMHDVGEYALRAVDVENDRKEIFNFPLDKRDQYYFGTSETHPDSIRGDAGVYQIWLNANSRNQFHETLRTCLTEFIRVRVDCPQDQGSPTASGNTSSTPKSITPLEPDKLISDIRQLGTAIKAGESEKAAELARNLAQHGIRLSVKSLPKESPNEEKFQIKVKIDGNNYPDGQDGEIISMFVYPSTTVDELRTVFEYSHKFPVSKQYFFVNGHLAYNKFTMHELQVHNDTLFILFVIT